MKHNTWKQALCAVFWYQQRTRQRTQLRWIGSSTTVRCGPSLFIRFHGWLDCWLSHQPSNMNDRLNKYWGTVPHMSGSHNQMPLVQLNHQLPTHAVKEWSPQFCGCHFTLINALGKYGHPFQTGAATVRISNWTLNHGWEGEIEEKNGQNGWRTGKLVCCGTFQLK